MNIFFLDKLPEKSAEMLCDKHVPKMLLETCQMLSTAYQRHMGEHEELYKSAYPKHPMTIWVGDSQANFDWSFDHAVEISKQYDKRFKKEHKSKKILQVLAREYILDTIKIPDIGFTEPPQCMPDTYKCDDYVKAYRDYYWNDKDYFAKWDKGVDMPDWWWDRMLGIKIKLVDTNKQIA
jgi:hypothetical protein